MLTPLLCNYDFKEKLHKGENWKLLLSKETSWSIFNAKLRKNSRLGKVPIAKDWKKVSFCVSDVYIPNFKFPSSEVKQWKVKMQNRLLQHSPKFAWMLQDSNFLFYCDFEFIFIYWITTTPNVKVLTSHNSRHILQIIKWVKTDLVVRVCTIGRLVLDTFEVQKVKSVFICRKLVVTVAAP